MSKYGQYKKESLEHAKVIILKALDILFTRGEYQDGTISGDMGEIVAKIAGLIKEGSIVSQKGHQMYTSNQSIRKVIYQLYKEKRYDVPCLHENEAKGSVKTANGHAARYVSEKRHTNYNARVKNMKQISGVLRTGIGKNGDTYYYLSIPEEQYAEYDGMLVHGDKETLQKSVGKYVGVRFQHASGKLQPTGKLIRVFEGSEIDIYTDKLYFDYYGDGDELTPEMEAQLRRQLDQINTEVTQDDIDRLNKRLKPENRIRNLNELAFTSMDPPRCKDIDDAVYTEDPQGNRQTQYVAIALVAYYVPKDSPVDNIAKNQAFTRYMGKKTKHMCDEKLSQGICALRAGKPRLTLCAKINYVNGEIDYDSSELFVATINSREELNYEQGDRIYAGDPEELSKHSPEVIRSVLNSFEVDRRVRPQRTKHGAIQFTTIESTYKLNEEGTEVVRATQDNNTISHCGIETAMQSYNLVFTYIAQKNGIPILYRSEKGIKEQEWESIVNYVKEMGLDINEDVDVNDIRAVQTEINRVIRQAEKFGIPKGSNEINRTFAHVVSTGIVRKLEKAKYTVDNIGHSSLNLEAYTHTTSPIRRLVDTINQRQMLAFLCGEPLPYTKQELAELQEHINDMELLGDEAERECAKLYEAFHIRKKLNEGENIIGNGHISSVQDDHIVVVYSYMTTELSENGIMEEVERYGTVRIEIPEDQRLDEYGRCKTHNMYHIGDTKAVKITHADLKTRTVYGALVAEKAERVPEFDLTL